MQLATRLLLVFCACIVMLAQFQGCSAFSYDRQKRDADDETLLQIEVLEGLLSQLKGEAFGHGAVKRRFDGGYGNRYGVAHSVGAKLMALKQAADWNSPGRKRREAPVAAPEM